MITSEQPMSALQTAVNRWVQIHESCIYNDCYGVARSAFCEGVATVLGCSPFDVQESIVSELDQLDHQKRITERAKRRQEHEARRLHN